MIEVIVRLDTDREQWHSHYSDAEDDLAFRASVVNHVAELLMGLPARWSSVRGNWNGWSTGND